MLRKLPPRIVVLAGYAIAALTRSAAGARRRALVTINAVALLGMGVVGGPTGPTRCSSFTACCRPRSTPGAVILIANAHASADEIDRRVSVRMKRQHLLTQPEAPELWTVLDEAVLRRPPGGSDVMRAQLEHLLEMTDLPNVTLQIVPFDVGPHAAAGGPFTILRFPEPDLPDLVYLEQLNSATYLDHPDDVINYVTVMDQLCVQAETSAVSKDMLRALLRQT